MVLHDVRNTIISTNEFKLVVRVKDKNKHYLSDES